jgi:MFS family permease
LIAVLMAQFAVIVNSSMINIALPSIASSLRFSASDMSWIINAYLVAFAGSLLLGGRLSDRFERRRLYQIGLGIFGFGSLLAAVAGDQAILLAGRALQGVGAAIAFPAALAILTTVYADGRGRNRALSAWGAVGGASGAVGSLVAGALTQASWRLDMLVNVPIVLLLLGAAPACLPEHRPENRVRKFDLPGAMVGTTALALLVYAISAAGAAGGWGSAATLERGAGALVLIGLFVVIERRATDPLMPLRLFRLSGLRGGNITNFFVSMSVYVMLTFNSLYLQRVLHTSPLRTGFESVPFSATIVLGAAVAARLTTRVGFKLVTLSGLLIGAVGLIWYSGISASGTYATEVLGPSLLVGWAIGMSISGVTIASLARVQSGAQGVAAGLVSTTHEVGKALGLAVLATIAAHATASAIRTQSPVAALDVGYQDAFLGAAAFALVGALLTLVVISTAASRAHAEAARAGEPVPAVA